MPAQKPVFKRLQSSRQRQGSFLSPIIGILTLAIVLALPPAAVLTQSAPVLRYLILASNLATYLVYRHDKRAAARQDGSRRVSESALHLWALAGGWLGAFVAQRVLRHKTRKWQFQAIFWVIVVLEECLCLRILGFL